MFRLSWGSNTVTVLIKPQYLRTEALLRHHSLFGFCVCGPWTPAPSWCLAFWFRSAPRPVSPEELNLYETAFRLRLEAPVEIIGHFIWKQIPDVEGCECVSELLLLYQPLWFLLSIFSQKYFRVLRTDLLITEKKSQNSDVFFSENNREQQMKNKV